MDHIFGGKLIIPAIVPCFTQCVGNKCINNKDVTNSLATNDV